jgi:hypothetical protein
MTLEELGTKYNSDKSGPKHHYTRDVYPRYLEKLRDKPIRLLELGIYKGSSARMWSEYFTHPDSEIVVADNWDLALKSDVGRAKAIWCDFRMNTAVEDLVKEGPFDVIVDDSCHIPLTQSVCLSILSNSLKPNGLYFIEDCQSGDNRKSMKNLQASTEERYTDYLNPEIHNLLVTAITKPWDFIHIYPKIVVYHKAS